MSLRDGRFRVNDEIINVNGHTLRGLSMEQARNVLKNTAQHVDITIARSPTPAPQSCGVELSNYDPAGQRIKSTGPKPLARRKRRLPVIDRPTSAPLSGEGLAGLCKNGGGCSGGSLLKEQQLPSGGALHASLGEEADESNYVLDVCDFSQVRISVIFP